MRNEENMEQERGTEGTDLSREASEAFLVELYRQDRITHHQLAKALGLSRLEADGVLKRHKVLSSPTLEELRAEIGSLRDARIPTDSQEGREILGDEQCGRNIF